MSPDSFNKERMDVWIIENNPIPNHVLLLTAVFLPLKWNSRYKATQALFVNV